MSKKIQTITLCSSVSFYKDLLEVEKQLKKLGFKVKIPKTAGIMSKNNNFNVSDYKTWYRDKKDYKIKTTLMNEHFKKVLQSDAILVINNEKKRHQRLYRRQYAYGNDISLPEQKTYISLE